MKNQTKLILIGLISMMILSSTVVIVVFADRNGPVIYEISILPVSPVEGDYISVKAYCTDSSGIYNTQLINTLDGETWQVQDMDFYACLFDAGGQWIGQFGPITDGDIIAFYVVSFDNSLNQNQAVSQTYTIEISN